ncbi:MAG: hypothetical protein EOL89_00045 [Actinobacteria bacterium]|nr:hypothetical protein [Actinomycetota bacterium]
MSADDRQRRGRRIHVEGVGSNWEAPSPPAGTPRPPGSPTTPRTQDNPANPHRPLMPPDHGRDAAGRPATGSRPATDSLAGAAAAHRVEAERANVQQRMTSIARRLTALRTALPDLREAEIAAAEDKVIAMRADAEARRADAVAAAERIHLSTLTSTSDRLRALVAELAPGPAAADFTAPDFTAQEGPPTSTAPARHTRFGHLGEAPSTVPAVAPLIDHPGWYVSAPDRQGVDLAFAATVRVLAQAPVKHVVVDVFDPRLTGAFGRLAPLRAVNGATFPIPASDARSFADRLGSVLDVAVRNVELVVANGARSLTDLWRRQGIPEGTLRLVVVLGYPYGVDGPLHELLVRTASAAGMSGTTLLVVEDPGARAAQDVSPDQLRQALHRISASDGAWLADGFPLPVTPDGAAPDSVVAAVLGNASEAARSVTGPVVPLRGLLRSDLENPWCHDSAESLEAVIGEANRQPLELSLRTENPPHPNVLIGGAVGQGKSNLLLDIIYSLAVRYGPDQLELHLLDFKRGLEFKRFDAGPDGTGWLPHVRVLSLESNQEFGIAVLRHIDEEMVRRSHLFKAAGANSINAYREETGQVLPRVLLVIDEFHILFEGEDEIVEQAVELMDRLAKQGRAYGIHLLLASQTTSGVRGLALKGDSIFAQFPLRMSLKNTPQESQAILSEGNKAAADLTYRGEVILNRNYGSDPAGSNIRGIAAFAEPEDMSSIQRALWERSAGAPPLVFAGRDYARWDEDQFTAHRAASAESADDGALTLWVGRPIAITSEPFTLTLEADADQAVAVVGPGGEVAAAGLRSMTLTACHSLAPRGGSLVILDGLGTAGWTAEVMAHAQDLGMETWVVERDHIAAWLRTELPGRLAERRASAPMLVLGLGLQRAREMDVSDAVDEDSFEASPTARDQLRRLATEGALAGVHLIGWWSTLRALEADLGPMLEGIAHVVTADLGRDELRSIAGPTVQRVSGSPRLGVHSRDGEGALVTVVPFDPYGRTGGGNE